MIKSSTERTTKKFSYLLLEMKDRKDSKLVVKVEASPFHQIPLGFCARQWDESIRLAQFESAI